MDVTYTTLDDGRILCRIYLKNGWTLYGYGISNDEALDAAKKNAYDPE